VEGDPTRVYCLLTPPHVTHTYIYAYIGRIGDLMRIYMISFNNLRSLILLGSMILILCQATKPLILRS